MASVDVEIGGRRYSIACRDGEEEHLRSVAGLVDRKAQDAEGALGSLGEARQLLFASLLLADELKDLRSGKEPVWEPDPTLAQALERLAERIEHIASGLETRVASA